MPPSKALSPVFEIQQQITGQRMTEQLKAALPEHISVEKFQRVVVTAVNKNADLVAADRTSLFTSCVECAQDGLMPDGKNAALVIFNTKAGKQWIKKVQYMPMIAGIYKRAQNSGEILTMNARIVYEKDVFECSFGFEPMINHVPNFSERGKVKAVYAIAILKDGTRDMEVMTVGEINEVKAVSKSGENGPWGTWWGEMARKTVVRRLAKRLPVSSDLERIIERGQADYEVREVRDVNSVRPPPPKRADFMVEDHEPEDVTGPEITYDENDEVVKSFVFADEDGAEWECSDVTLFAEQYTECLNRLTGPALFGVWETNVAEISRLRTVDAAVAQGLTELFMSKRV